MKPFPMALAAASLAICLGAPAQAQDPDQVLARVGDTEITLGHLVGLMARLPEQYRQLSDQVLFDGILEQLVDQAAIAQGLSEPMPRRMRIDLDNSRREVIVNHILTDVAEAAITEEALRALYAERYLEAEPEREFNAAHILVETEEEAAALRQELLDGADFAALARQRSGDPGSAQNGGDLGWFGAGRMVAPFEEAVMALAPGEVSEPVETQFGWHLIRLNDTRLLAAPEFAAVRDRLAMELRQQAVIAHIAEARAAVTVEITADGIDPSVIRDQTVLDAD